MALLIRAKFTRAYHTSPISFQLLKDANKVLSYRAPFDEEQKKEVLEKINFLPQKELCDYTGQKISKLIDDHRTQKGTFDSVEQLLEIPNVKNAQLVKICNSLLENLSVQAQEKKLTKGNSKDFKSIKGIFPKPDSKLWKSLENPTLVGVSVTLQGVTYTKIDSAKKHCDWSAMPGVENPTSQISFQHKNVFFSALQISQKLPQADYYLFEEQQNILSKDPYMKDKVNLIKLRSTLLTILMKQKDKKSVGIHTINPSVLDKMFSLKVGNERTSIQDALDRIISVDSPFHVQISEETWCKYKECNNQGKEYLASSLLKVLAFNHVCKEAHLGSGLEIVID